jgi:hypothetical protein
MTDLVTTARTARERLSVGLNALQNPGAPETLQAAAEPIASAMTALLQIERTGAIPISRGGPNVLDLVRQALAKLQAETGEHPSLTQAMESVAGSLGLVYGLVQRVSSIPPGSPGATSGAPQAVVASKAVAAAPRVAPMQPVATTPQRAVRNAPTASVPRPSTGGTVPSASVPRPQRSTPVEGAKLQSLNAQSTLASQKGAGTPATAGTALPLQKPMAAQTPVANEPTLVASARASRPDSLAGPTPLEIPAAKIGASAPVAVAATAAAAIPPGPVAGANSQTQRVAAELGAHSATNFYKGLSGNDVVDSGGIFIATYQIPPIGRDLLIRVSLPGGYEFEAKGVVRWTREANSTSGDAVSPGFGAQFTDISPEARQLVYRYARNREPLFHDDL